VDRTALDGLVDFGNEDLVIGVGLFGVATFD
jgi:hypothetical protein